MGIGGPGTRARRPISLLVDQATSGLEMRVRGSEFVFAMSERRGAPSALNVWVGDEEIVMTSLLHCCAPYAIPPVFADESMLMAGGGEEDITMTCNRSALSQRVTWKIVGSLHFDRL